MACSCALEMVFNRNASFFRVERQNPTGVLPWTPLVGGGLQPQTLQQQWLVLGVSFASLIVSLFNNCRMTQFFSSGFAPDWHASENLVCSAIYSRFLREDRTFPCQRIWSRMSKRMLMWIEKNCSLILTSRRTLCVYTSEPDDTDFKTAYSTLADSGLGLSHVLLD